MGNYEEFSLLKYHQFYFLSLGKKRYLFFLPLYTHFTQMQLVQKSHLKPGHSSSTTVKAEKGKSLISNLLFWSFQSMILNG